MPKDQKFPKQAVGVFDSPEHLEEALDRLQEAHFDQDRISVVGMQDVLSGKLRGVRTVVDLQNPGPEIKKAAPMRHVEMNELRAAAIGFPAYAAAIAAGAATIASGGAAAGVIAATVSGGAGGALLGAIFTAWLNHKRAAYYREQLSHGGILLWVTLINEEEEARIKQLLPALSIEPVTILESKPSNQ